MAKGTGKGKTKNRTNSPDPIFFTHHPSPTPKEITDVKPSPDKIRAIHQTHIDKLPSRFIGADALRSETRSGTLIPVSHFRPLVQKLIRDGEIDPKNFDATVTKLRDITDQLIPAHISSMDPTYTDGLLTHGEHFSPLVAVQCKKGRCYDWAAVFTALGRSAGLSVALEGSPNFYHEYPTSERAHIWPVAISPDGRRVPVLTEGHVDGLDKNHAGAFLERVQTEQKIKIGQYPRYAEHKPARPVQIPKELHVSRPDVFGD